MNGLKTLGCTLAIGVGLVMATDYMAMAATGQTLILGQFNQAEATTTVRNTGSGPAARFVAEAGTPAIAVSGDAKIARLNADLLDGKDASELGAGTRVFTVPVNVTNASAVQAVTSPVPAGTYLVTLKGGLEFAAASGSEECYATSDEGPAPIVSDTAIGTGDFFSVNAVGVVTLTAPRAVTLTCYSQDEVAGSITQGYFSPLQLAFTRVSKLSETQLTATGAQP